MKKLLIAVLAGLCLTGCAVAEPEVSTEPMMYIASGHYYTSGEVITDDGNIWGYSQDIISDVPGYDDEPVYVLFYDAGTPDNIYDDEIVGLVGR
jgi:hypothetical protein